MPRMTVYSALLWENSPMADPSLETQGEIAGAIKKVAISALTECAGCFGTFFTSPKSTIVHHEEGESHPFHKKCLFQWLARSIQIP